MTTHLSICLPTASRGGVRVGVWKPAPALHVASRRQGRNAFLGVALH